MRNRNESRYVEESLWLDRNMCEAILRVKQTRVFVSWSDFKGATRGRGDQSCSRRCPRFLVTICLYSVVQSFYFSNGQLYNISHAPDHAQGDAHCVLERLVASVPVSMLYSVTKTTGLGIGSHDGEQGVHNLPHDRIQGYLQCWLWKCGLRDALSTQLLT